jgi:dipeptidyl aminopeptidase/acylaminoacyl peptidase
MQVRIRTRGIWAALLIIAVGAPIAPKSAAQAAGFTIEQALSAPFCTDLRAAPAKGRLAWVANIGGRRNLWVAEPAAGGKDFVSRQITHYSDDDGQELSAPEWTPDGESVVFVRGDSVQGEGHPVPNPAWFAKGAQQQVWIVNLHSTDTEPRLLGEGHSPAVAPDGKSAAYLLKGQVWLASLDEPKQGKGKDSQAAKPEQLLQTRGSAGSLHWSPDGTRLAFVSDRDDHSFIVVYTVASKSITYLDPSTDLDGEPVWSPDSSHIAFLRVPPDKDSLLFVAHRTALPWSIRVADVATGKGRAIWQADEGPGSAFREIDAPDQLHWTAGDRIVFPWERDGWLHLYAVPAAGGAATPLTPGSNFEVEHVSLSSDRKTLVFDSNQNDIDRRHAWRISFAGDDNAVQPVTSGDGIETQPVVASDGATVAVLRSDARVPIRAAAVESRQLVDLVSQAIPADFPGAHFVVPQQVIFPAADGLELHGQLFLPPNADASQRKPAVVFFHGGSQRQMLLGWHYMEYYSNAYAMNQYLASQGFVVLSVNYRSGIGYGLNFREALNYGASGASEFNDVMGAGLYLKSRPDVDGAHIASWGGSYGGYLTALALARASSLFAAGVDMHGVHDWNLELPTFSPNYDPRVRPDIARLAFESSPMASVDTWRSPVLLIHGDDDRNVPFAETVQLVEALRRHKVEFEELIFPDEIHDFLLRRDWVRAYTASAEFLHRKLASGGATH